MRKWLLAWMAIAALMAAACTQSGHLERSASAGAVIGEHVGAATANGR
jgi:hypothetical protein